ncbi:uncharacterized protein FFMR_05859 [Fusarium fujikuroi]|nr:uncharacterized protein FFMR_05859 [Fusarium fujikuroi]
MAYISLLPSP